MLVDKTIKRLYFYSLLFFALLLPFQFKTPPLTLGLMFYALVWLVTLGFGRKFKWIGSNPMALLLLLYSAWVALGTLYSQYPDQAVKDLVLKVPFAAWPLLLGSVMVFTVKDRERLVNGFIYSSAVAILFSIGRAVFRYASTGDDSYLYYSELVYFDMIPPHYFGMYISFVYGVVFYRLLNGKVLAGRHWLSMAVLLLCFLALILVSARMQYVVFVLVNVSALFFFKNPVKTKTKLVWTLSAMLAFFILAYSFPGSRSRMIDTVNEIVSFEEMVDWKQTNHRKFLWDKGWEVIEENFWMGTGSGGAEEALSAKLENVDAPFWDGEDVYFLRDKGYNLHNSYLQHWAAHGIIGFLILMTVMLVPLFIKRFPAEGKIFLLVCIFSFMTESMLERQAGVLFFTFFYCLFFVMRPRSEAEEEQDRAKEPNGPIALQH